MRKIKLYEYIDEAIRKLKEAGVPNGEYCYIFPSPNKGKRLLIKGFLGPGEAANIAYKIHMGELSVDMVECAEEIDN